VFRLFLSFCVQGGPDAGAGSDSDDNGGKRKKQRDVTTTKKKKAGAEDAKESSKAAKRAEEEAAGRRAAELELLLMDEGALLFAAAAARKEGAAAGGAGAAGGGAKLSLKERARLKREQRRREREAGSDDEDLDGAAAFKSNLEDPRFADLFTSADFALDPTNPRFIKEKGLAHLAKEVAKRRSAAVPVGGKKGEAPRENNLDKTAEAAKGGNGAAAGTGSGADLRMLVASLKRKTGGAVATGDKKKKLKQWGR
jgi:hypothetical protein